MGCCYSKKVSRTPRDENPTILASETPFTESEVEALYELFKKLSSSIIDDGLIHKEEFQLALFRNSKKENLFADRIFDLFDLKRNGVIDFGEFVRSLGVFHPNTPVEQKIEFAFRLYDLRQTGFIEREELNEMVLALLHESDLILSNDVVETIVDKVTAANKMSKKSEPLINLDHRRIQNIRLFYIRIMVQNCGYVHVCSNGRVFAVAGNDAFIVDMVVMIAIEKILAYLGYIAKNSEKLLSIGNNSADTIL